jgi:hypothetical protein
MNRPRAKSSKRSLPAASASKTKRRPEPPSRPGRPPERMARLRPGSLGSSRAVPTGGGRVSSQPAASPGRRLGKAARSLEVALPGDGRSGVKLPLENGARKDGAVKDGAGKDLGKYVYCVIQAQERMGFGPLGLGAGPSEVYTVNWGDLAAVVSDTPMGVHDPTRENVLAHQRVNETVMREHTVIPMSFGTVFKTDGDIIELLKSAYEAFKDVLSKMQNKFEFGLKVLWERDQVVREIEDQDEDIRRLKNEILNQKGSTYFARMQYGRMIDAALQGRSEFYVSEIFNALRDVSVASRSNKPIGDKMIMNAAFLVLRDKEKDFDAKVKEIGGRHDKLTFKYTGPWPPYNFVNIRLKLERAPQA